MPVAIPRNSAAAELLARFRRRRPRRAGSLIITIFGDSILPRGGAIALGSLIELAAPFGLNARLVRTAIARLANEDWLEGRRLKKLSEYHLSRRGAQRFAEATRRIYGEPEGAWAGRWTLVVVPPMRATERHRLREELLWRGFGEISATLFAHPEFDGRARAPRRGGLPSKVIAFEAVLAADAAHRLVQLGWDLNDLARRYRRLLVRFRLIAAALQEAPQPEPGECFMVRTLLIHEYRRLHLRDPLLPAPLLRGDWPGAQAAQLCRDIYTQVFAASESYLSRVAATLRGPLPAADATVWARFGGIRPR